MIEKGISFDDIHSYNNLGLILSAVEIPPAEPKENYVDLPGGDGAIDLTEVHGEVKFYDREGCKFTFTMNPSMALTDESFEEKKKEVSNALNGKWFEKIILDKDSGYYYQGRCKVDDFLSDRRIRQIVVTARLKPYKYKKNVTEKSFSLSSSEKTITLENSRKTVVPEITCTNDNTTISFGMLSFNVNAGTHKILEFQLKEGINQVKVSGSGTITFKYQEADL